MKSVAIFLSLVIIISFCGCKKEEVHISSSEYIYMGADYIHRLTNGYSISRTDATRANFINGCSSDGTYYNSNIILEYITIIKYSYSDDDRFIFIHYYDGLIDADNKTELKYNGSYCDYDAEIFYIYDTIGDKTESFSDYTDYKLFCEKNSIDFDCYYYPSAGGSVEENRITIDEKAYISSRGSYLGQSLVVDDEIIFDGYIDEYTLLSDGLVCFKLTIADDDYSPEFNTSNSLLKVDYETTQGKYFAGSIVMCFDVYYEKYIMYDINQNTITEINSKSDANKKIKEFSKDDIEWITINK